jgi:hypothetical protein
MKEFTVRPAYTKPELPLIEFRGDHRADGFPSVLRILESALQGLSVTGTSPTPDDFLWVCQYAGGCFEISDDWGGLFITPLTNTAVVVEEVAAALVCSGLFKRVTWWVPNIAFNPDAFGAG